MKNKKPSQPNSITTVRVDRDIYEEFKIENVRSKFTLQDLVNKGMYLYLNDQEFKNKINSCVLPLINTTVTSLPSGSIFLSMISGSSKQ